MVDRSKPFSVRVSESSVAAYKEAAEKAGLSTSEWARLVLDAAAGISEFPEQLTRVVEFKNRTVRDGKW